MKKFKVKKGDAVIEVFYCEEPEIVYSFEIKEGEVLVDDLTGINIKEDYIKEALAEAKDEIKMWKGKEVKSLVKGDLLEMIQDSYGDFEISLDNLYEPFHDIEMEEEA